MARKAPGYGYKRKALKGTPYVGGKSIANMTGVGPWVSSLIPYDSKGIYCEPCAGMIGVMLQRPKSRTEIANDADEVVVNFWRVMRDSPTELKRLIEHTPYAAAELEWAMTAIGDAGESAEKRALAFVIRQYQSYRGTTTGKWSPGFDPIRQGPNRDGDWTNGLSEMVLSLARRLRSVQLTNEDALRTLERLVGREDAVIYVDPPYKDTYSPYVASIDYDALGRVMKEQQGFVAVSGYADEWDHLGWERHTKNTWAQQTAKDGKKEERTEVLWTNRKVLRT